MSGNELLSKSMLFQGFTKGKQYVTNYWLQTDDNEVRDLHLELVGTIQIYQQVIYQLSSHFQLDYWEWPILWLLTDDKVRSKIKTPEHHNKCKENNSFDQAQHNKIQSVNFKIPKKLQPRNY